RRFRRPFWMVTVTSGETKLDWRTADAAAAFLPAGVAWNAAAVPGSSTQTPSEHTRSRIQCRETIGGPPCLSLHPPRYFPGSGWLPGKSPRRTTSSGTPKARGRFTEGDPALAARQALPANALA